MGLDYGILDGRINGSVDYYSRTTKDALFNYSVPTPPYFYGNIAANVAQIKNSGLDFLVNVTPFQTENFQWTANLTYSTNTNEIVSLSNVQKTGIVYHLRRVKVSHPRRTKVSIVGRMKVSH